MIRLLSWNIANFDDHINWPERLENLASEIIENQPDLILLQEIRFNKKYKTHLNSAEQILKLVAEKDASFKDFRIVTQPAMIYKKFEHWEGLTIISKFPINRTGAIFYTLAEGCPDINQRIGQYAIINIGYQDIFVLNTHFSYCQEGMRQNIEESLEFVTQYNNLPIIIAGDMNSVPENKEISRFSFFDFHDCWKLLNVNELGYTYPSDNPKKRIDYILVNNEMKNKVNRIKLIGKKTMKSEIFPSDHCGLLLDFQ